MKFLPTLNLWNPAIQAAVISGQIKLQVGQWVQCGPGAKSRFVCVRPSGSIWCVHADGPVDAPRISATRFSECVEVWLGKLSVQELRERRRQAA